MESDDNPNEITENPEGTTEVLTLWTAAIDHQGHEIYKHLYARDLQHAQELARTFLGEYCVPLQNARFQEWSGGRSHFGRYYHGRVVVRKGQQPEGWQP